MRKMISRTDKIIIGLIIGAGIATWLIDSGSVKAALIFGIWYVGLCLVDINNQGARK